MDHIEDPLEEYAKIRMNLEKDILHGKSPTPDGRHVHLRLGFAEKYKHIPLEKMIIENAKGLNWGRKIISAFESLYSLGDDLLRLSAKGEELQSDLVALDQELQEICGTADILRGLGYRIIGDTRAFLPKWYQVKRENTSVVLAELRLAKDDMIIFLKGKHVLHDDICQLIPTDYCPSKKRRSRKETTMEKNQTVKAETSPCDATKEDKTDITDMASSQPENLTAEESRCPHCDFINLADASLCISCAEPLTDTRLFVSHAETPKDTKLFISQIELQTNKVVAFVEPRTDTSVPHDEQQTIISVSRAESQKVTSVPHAEPPKTITSVSRAEPQRIHSVSCGEPWIITSVSRAEPQTITFFSRAEPQTITSDSPAEPQTITNGSPGEPQTITSVPHAELQTVTRVSRAEPHTSTSVSQTERQTGTCGLPAVSQKTESGVGTKDEISCPHCTFFNPGTNKICIMCSKTISSSPSQSPQAGYLDLERQPKSQHRTVINLIGDSAASVMGHKAVTEEKKSTEVIKVTGASAGLVDDNPLHEEEAQQLEEENGNRGCPRCTFQNPLPTDYCRMCNQRLTKELVKCTTDLTKNQTAPTGEQIGDTKQTMPHHLVSHDYELKEFMRCPICKGTLRNNSNAESRACSCCHRRFCLECRNPVKEDCSRLSCRKKCYCYHRRTCTHWLSQQWDWTLERFLQKKKCPYQRFLEWHSSHRGNPLQSEYKDYLIKLILDHNIDPADGMTDFELRELVRTALGVDIEVFGYTKENLIEFVKKNIP